MATPVMVRELLLLGLLRRQEMHGYQMNEFLAGEMAICTDIKKPTAYYLLNKLAEQGWIAEYTEQEGNRPPRRVYRITSEGERVFQALLRETLPVFTPTFFDGDLPLAFLDELPPAEARQLLDQRLISVQQANSMLKNIPAHTGSIQWLIEHQRKHLEVELDLLNQIRMSIDNQAE